MHKHTQRLKVFGKSNINTQCSKPTEWTVEENNRSFSLPNAVENTERSVKL